MSAIIEWDIEEDLTEKPSDELMASMAVNTVAEWAPEDVTIESCLAAGAEGVMIPNETYHRLPGISGSNLKLLAESNRHLDCKHLFFTSTPALIFGSLLHTMVLEPDDVLDRYVVMPKFETKAKTGLSIEHAKQLFYADNKGKTIIERATFRKAEKMARNVRAICGNVINKGIKERSLFAEIDGLILKCRLDIDLEDDGDDWDLKSITLGVKDFSDVVLEQHIKKWKYHWSAAFRNIIRRQLGKPVRDSYLIFCDTGPGHHVRVIKIRPLWIKEAETEVQDMLDSRRYYLKTHIDVPVVEIDDKAADRLRKLLEY